MENNLIDRQAAIDALDGNVIVTRRESAQAVMDYIRGCADKIRSLPSAQPELIEKAAYIRGFEQGRTQGMIDTKAEEVAQTNLQPTCNQLATDTISRRAAIDGKISIQRTNGVEIYDDYAVPVEYLRKLPPALPDLDEWCTGCKEYDKERNSCPRWNRVIKETLKDLQEERKTQLSEESTTSDYINRCDAIDAVKKNTFRLTFAEEQNCEGHVAWSANAVYSDVIEGKLLGLPSAQPEIIRCGECTHKDKKIDYCHYLGITICERDYCSYGERRTDEGDRC